MLSAEELQTSEIVANATMNRGRGLTGVNSYGKELGFDIAAFLQARVEERGAAVWYDACCGEGRALGEAARQFEATLWGKSVRIVGVDLGGMFADAGPNVEFVAADVGAFRLDEAADLITCVHGLHYLGDKLGFLENAYARLRPGGLFLGHLDAQNLQLPVPWPQMVRRVRAQGIALDFRRHVLRLERTGAALHFGAAYQGATVSETPNYTGITVINSWYAAPG